MKILSTGDMYNYAKDHPGARFKRLRASSPDLLYYFNDTGDLIVNNTGVRTSDFPQLNEQWELIPQAVDFMTAANSDRKIRPEDDPFAGFHKLDCWSMTKERINGKWFIEE